MEKIVKALIKELKACKLTAHRADVACSAETDKNGWTQESGRLMGLCGEADADAAIISAAIRALSDRFL